MMRWVRRAALALLAAVVFAVGAVAQNLPLEPEAEKDPALDNPLRVTGVVRGPTGPAEGVQVMLEVSDMRIRRQVAFLQGRTDSQGMFEIDLAAHDMPRYGLQFNTLSVRYVGAQQIVQKDRSEFPIHVEFDLRAGTVARGTVVDDEGNPIEGATITATGIRPAQSDAEGNWEAFGLEPGGASLLFRKEGHAEQTLPIESNGPEIVEGLKVVMPSATRFGGRTVNGAGNPVKFPLVFFVAGERYLRATGDAEGNFEFKGVPADMRGTAITAMAEGYLPTTHELTEEEATAGTATIVVDSGVFFEGRALLPSGEVAPGAIVVAGPTFARSVPQATAGADGKWEVGPFPPFSPQLLTILPPSPEPSWGVADLVLNPTGPNQYAGDVELWPKGFGSAFTAAFNDGKVGMYRRDNGVGGLAGPVKYTAPWDGVSEEIKGTLEVVGFAQGGTFTMRRTRGGQGLAGEWELREELEASKLGLAPRQVAFVAPGFAGRMTVDMTLDEGLRLAGTVLRGDGRPFIDGTVFLTDWEGTSVYQPTAEIRAGGRFEFDRVPQGTFMLHAISRDETLMTVESIARGGIDGFVLREGGADEDPIDE